MVVVEVLEVEGELVLWCGWLLMFCVYFNDDECYCKSFVGDWYLSGDLVWCDVDGYFWFVGCVDDMIKLFGYFIGFFEVEFVLMEYLVVYEVGVIGKFDLVVGEIVKVFVVFKFGVEGGEVFWCELLGFVCMCLGVVVVFKEIVFIVLLFKMCSGKIMCCLLCVCELGLFEGDISILELL